MIGLAGLNTNASAQGVSCSAGSQRIEFDPLVTSFDQNVTLAIDASFDKCTGVPGISSGTAAREVMQSVYSCSTLLQAITGSEFITWSNGQTSTFNYTTTMVPVPNENALMVTLTGTISAGQFQGQAAKIRGIYIANPFSYRLCSDLLPISGIWSSGRAPFSLVISPP
jgi:hypothetical protein